MVNVDYFFRNLLKLLEAVFENNGSSDAAENVAFQRRFGQIKHNFVTRPFSG